LFLSINISSDKYFFRYKDSAKEWNGKTIDKKDVKTEQEIKKNTCLFLFLRLLIIK